MTTDSLSALGKRWRLEASLYMRDGANAQACILNRCADDLEDAQQAVRSTLLSLSDAAAASGYSADYLGRLVRRGQIQNYGRKGSPKIRLMDLPLRPTTGALASQPRHRLDVAGDGV